MPERTVEFRLGGTLKFLLDEPEVRPGAIITLRYDGLSITTRGEGMAYTLPNDHVVNVQISYIDAKGNAAQVDGEVAWSSSDEAIAIVAVDSGDSTQARVRPSDQLGQAQITATADADLGEGTREIITTMDVTIVAGSAVSGTITPVGEPLPIAPTATPR
jgi:hypothetical protein